MSTFEISKGYDENKNEHFKIYLEDIFKGKI